MKFTTNTKPLIDALNLGIINANVSNFHKKSCIVQLVATKSILKINIEAARICTEIKLKGIGDADTTSSIFVSSLLLKQLVATLESATVTLEFGESGLTIHSGKSKFTLPKMIDEAELELEAPELPDYTSPEIDIDKSDWRFIKDNQMYAIAMSFIHPVYTRVWVGEGGDVLVGDFDNSLFTHSVKSKLGNTCLLSDTIVNLFNSLPEGTKLIKKDTSYLVKYESDAFSYLSQFTPQYESDEDIGSYNSEIFLDMMDHPDTGCYVNAGAITKFLNQASLLSTNTDDTIKFSVEGDDVKLRDNNVDCSVNIEGAKSAEFIVEFKTESLRRVISNYGEDVIYFIPAYQGDEVAGVIFWNKDLTTILAGVED